MEKRLLLYGVVTLLVLLQQSFKVVAQKACVPDKIEDHQKMLRLHYPNLIQLIRNISITKQLTPNDGAGTVIFLNTQDKTFPLECPCKGGKYEWILHTNENGTTDSDDFKNSKYDVQKIRPRTPSPKNYFRIYECSTDNRANVHYFNVFTRPLPRTTFPIQWIEGYETDSVRREELEFTCDITDTIRHDPYTIKWKKKNSNVTVTLDSNNKDGNMSDLKFTFHGVTRSNVKPSKLAATIEMAGEYECVVIDNNNLSSSFRDFPGKGDLECCRHGPSHGRYFGFADVHVRGKYMFTWPLGVIGGGFVILVLLIMICPNSHEQQEMDKSNAATAKEAAEREEKSLLKLPSASKTTLKTTGQSQPVVAEAPLPPTKIEEPPTTGGNTNVSAAELPGTKAGVGVKKKK